VRVPLGVDWVVEIGDVPRNEPRRVALGVSPVTIGVGRIVIAAGRPGHRWVGAGFLHNASLEDLR
jgi:hypothetical protein